MTGAGGKKSRVAVPSRVSAKLSLPLSMAILMGV